MLKKFLSIGLVMVVLCLSAPLSHAQEIRIGVLANRGAAQALEDWKATADYLSAKSGKSFVIVPLSYPQVVQYTKEGKLEFLLTNSAQYAELNKLYGIQAIATVVNQYKNQPMDQFGATIIVRADSPIKTVEDLKGVDYGTASKSAFGGWLMAQRVLIEKGLNPDRDLNSIRELKTHDNVIYAVYNKAIAAGSVRTGSLEKMIQEGKVKREDFRIINQINDNFPLMHSSQLYPEYPLAALSQTPQGLRNDVVQILIAMAPTDPALAAARIAGWKKPLEYAPVVECLTAVKYGIFGK